MIADTAKLRLYYWLEARADLPDSTVLSNYTFAELGMTLGDVRELADEIDRLRKDAAIVDWLESKIWAGDLYSVPGLQDFAAAFDHLQESRTITDDNCEERSWIREVVLAAIAAQPKVQNNNDLFEAGQS